MKESSSTEKKSPFLYDSFRIATRQSDMFGQAKISSFFSFMQEAAWQHAQKLNLGYAELKEKKLFWVLSRQKVVIEQYPTLNDRCSIKTWPCGLNGIFGLRDFLITSSQDRVLARATSAWLALSRETRRPRRLDSGLDLPGNYVQERALDCVLKKIPPLEHFQPVMENRVRYGDIDINGHVNNVCYISWLENLFGAEFIENMQLKSAEVNYLAETRLNDHIAWSKSESGEGIWTAEAHRLSDNVAVFRARTHWGPRT